VDSFTPWTLYLGERMPVSVGQEEIGAPLLVLKLWKREKFLAYAPNGRSVVQQAAIFIDLSRLHSFT
jgi:hypothetical protein